MKTTEKKMKNEEDVKQEKKTEAAKNIEAESEKTLSPRVFLAGWFLLSGILLSVIILWMICVDPYMHFHAPDTARYYYTLSNQRSQNDGIMRYFEYDAILTGSSMIETFSASEMDELFDCRSVKLPFSGASYKEISDNLERAMTYNTHVKMVVRALDYSRIIEDKDSMRFDMGVYPNYLYDDNPFNDIEYVLNREVFWNRVFPMTIFKGMEGFAPGITSFDDYGNWQSMVVFGKNAVLSDENAAQDSIPQPLREGTGNMQSVQAEKTDASQTESATAETAQPDTAGRTALTEEERKMVTDNITQNVITVANAHPDTVFYLFFSPYSAAWWQEIVKNGTIEKQIEAEEIAIRLMLECDNIRLFSFNNETRITTNLNHYKDPTHYAAWVSDLILRDMQADRNRLTPGNADAYLREELDFYLHFDYATLETQEDYDTDTRAITDLP